MIAAASEGMNAARTAGSEVGGIGSLAYAQVSGSLLARTGGSTRKSAADPERTYRVVAGALPCRSMLRIPRRTWR
jgi:hypothetical protein